MGRVAKCHTAAALQAGSDPVPAVQETGLASAPVRSGEENLSHTGVRERTAQHAVSGYNDYAIPLQPPDIRTDIERQ